MLGAQVVPVLRREFASAARPAHVPDAPTHASRSAAAAGGCRAGRRSRRRPTAAAPQARRPSDAPDRDAPSLVVVIGRPQRSRPRRGCSPTGWRRRPTARSRDARRRRRRSEVVELREHAQDLDEQPADRLPEPAPREAAIDAVVGADGLIAVTPIFNASYSGLFKLFFDVLEQDSLAGKPVLIGRDRRHGAPFARARARAAAAVRLPRARPWSPTAVFAAAEDWGAGADPIDGALVDRIERAGGELAAAIAARPRQLPVDPFADPVPFEDCSTPARRATGPPDALRARARTASRRSVSAGPSDRDDDLPEATNPTRSHIRAAATFSTAVNEWTTRWRRSAAARSSARWNARVAIPCPCHGARRLSPASQTIPPRCSVSQ